MPIAVSPRYLDSDFEQPWPLQAKILVFADATFGWQIDVAASMCTNPHAGFAILSVILSYFEMIAKYETGDSSRDSPRHFREGVKMVLGPHAAAANVEAIPDELIATIYGGARCGLYHMSATSGAIIISGDPSSGLAWNGRHVVMNPCQLVTMVHRHFASYVGRLCNPAPEHDPLRKNFEMLFDSR